ncbi:hypothetical protein ABC766_07770 [Methylobacterium fujisawaense]|uniref:hypothetical protein n=1 Tax=Methylobacterium fujisawaense TaxID=107400 RepID=UPI0031F4FF56
MTFVTAGRHTRGDTRHQTTNRREDVMRRSTELRVKCQIWRDLDLLLAQRAVLDGLNKHGATFTKAAANHSAGCAIR